MSYHIYTTDSIILSFRPIKEADRVYSILTRDFGLVRATAGGVRKEVSKLRPALEPVVFSSVSMVRGKDYWRITSASLLEKVPRSREISRTLLLLENLMQGEAPHPELFDDLQNFLHDPDVKDEMLEIRLVATILFHLGYLKDSDLQLEKKELIKAINEGIQASGLTK